MTEKRSAFVYLIGISDQRVLGSIVKVGIAHNVTERMAGLQQGIPFKLELLGDWQFSHIGTAKRAEMTFHKRFRGHRVRGEWFDMSRRDAYEGVEVIYSEKLGRGGEAELSGARDILGAAAYYRAVDAVSVSSQFSQTQRSRRKRAA